MSNANHLKNQIYVTNKEIFDIAEDAARILFSVLKDFNAQKIKLMNTPSHKRIYLFFLARVIKTYSAICMLCREGYGQDACPLLRSLLEILISAKYIIYKPAEADHNAVRFVEYKWVILKRFLSELEREALRETSDELLSDQDLIANKFQEFKQKYGIISDKALLTWSGKSIKDMARLTDRSLLKEYELAFRIDSRFSHPSIIGDKEYLDYQEDALVFSFLPSSSGVVLSLKRGVTYLADFLAIFNGLFNLDKDKSIQELKSKITEIFNMEKYKKALSFEKSLPSLDKEHADKIVVQFNISI